ncbi:MAG: glycosyltransferase family 4 protein [Sedimentisphaerales bacterium]|nr:glycosyltransferase family 4 protein [Sedimentisphaerales bacterium]
MKIAHLTPSSGDTFYCENCQRDIALVNAMQKMEHEILLMPMYLPVNADEKDLPTSSPIFFGGVNVYLQQKLSIFRKTPRWLDKLFDNPKLLQWAGRKAGMTSAKDLAETTISMLNGNHGKQVKELNRLVDWLALEENKPDIVTLSNVLLVGLVKPIKERLGVPVLCLLQDEDGFIDGLGAPYAKQSWDIVTELAKDIDLFISVSKYYSDVMQERLSLEPELLEVVRMGISLDGYLHRDKLPEVPTIGYLSRSCSERGLDKLVDAFIILKKNDKLKNARLRISGGARGDDAPFIDSLKKRLSNAGIIDDVEFLPDFSKEAKYKFLNSLSVMCVPEKQPVAYGLYVLEALASGVPVVEPAIGVFPELIELTGGGVLYNENNAQSLAKAMEPLLLDPDYAHKLGQKGRDAVTETLNVENNARELITIYERIVQKKQGG